MGFRSHKLIDGWND
jgi:hypothetical protein